MNTNDLSLLTAKTKKKKLINSIENHINNKYHEIALSHLNQSILSEVHTAINEKIISIPCLHSKFLIFWIPFRQIINAVLGKDTMRRTV